MIDVLRRDQRLGLRDVSPRLPQRTDVFFRALQPAGFAGQQAPTPPPAPVPEVPPPEPSTVPTPDHSPEPDPASQPNARVVLIRKSSRSRGASWRRNNYRAPR